MQAFNKQHPLLKIVFLLVAAFISILLFVSTPPINASLLSILRFGFLLITLWLLFNLKTIQLYTKIFLGLLTGILAGLFLGKEIAVFYPVGLAFLRLIKMIVVPLVFASVFVGTASLGDVKKLGRIGVRTVLYYIISTAIAITIGLLLANLLRPGSDIPADIQSQLMQNYRQEAHQKIEVAAQRPSLVNLFLRIIPTNPFAAMNEANMLQIIFFAIICGIAITYILPRRRELLIDVFQGIADITIQLVHIIMKLAPYGVFALIATVIGQYGVSIIHTLLGYFGTVLLALLIHVVFFNSAVIKFLTEIPLKKFWKDIQSALLVAFSTSSSSATLPVSIECAEEKLRVKPTIASFVLPLGSTINMDGTAIFQGVSAVFIATVYGINLSFGDQLTILLIATLASIGTPGAPQVGIILLTMVLQSIGIPLEGIALILGVERFLDMSRTVVNVTGDLACAAVINQFEQTTGGENP